MTKIYLFLISAYILFFFTPSFLVAQGLDYEYNFEDSHSQKITAVNVDGDFTYVAMTEVENYYNPSYLVKTSKIGVVVFKRKIETTFSKYTTVRGIVLDQNKNIIVAGQGVYGCEPYGGSFQFIMKFSPGGDLIWNRFFYSGNRYCHLEGLTIDAQDQLQFNIYYTDSISTIYQMHANGSLDDELIVQQENLRNIYKTTHQTYLATNENKVVEFEAAGEIVQSINFSTPIQSMIKHLDTLYILTADSLHYFTPNLIHLASSTIENYSNYSALKMLNDSIYVMTRNSSNISILLVNRDFSVANVKNISINTNTTDFIDFSENQLSLLNNFYNNSFSSVRLRNYKFDLLEDNSINRTDIGVVNFKVDDFKATPYTNIADMYDFEISGSVLVKNYGDKPLHSFKIYHYNSLQNCNDDVFQRWNTNTTIAPGDSAWVNLWLFHSNMHHNPGNIFTAQICLYSGNPNNLVDLNNSNNQFCKHVYLGTLGIEELELNEKKVVKIVDVLGRETQSIYNQVVFYIYEDGTSKKVFQLSE